MMSKRFTLVILAVFAVSSPAQENAIRSEALTDSELQLKAIFDNVIKRESESVLSLEKKSKAAKLQESRHAELTNILIQFEQSHRATDVGLMAARQLIRLGGNVPDGPNDPRVDGRRHALRALPHYSENEFLPVILREVDKGFPELTTEECLREIADLATAAYHTQMFAQLALARWILNQRDEREMIEARLDEISNGDALKFPEESEYLTNWLGATVSNDKIPMLEQEAISLLESLASTESNVRAPAVSGKDERGLILQIDHRKTESMPTIRDSAGGLLFHEQHLRIGKPAPELNLELIDKTRWSLAQHRGKTVIIQFSFKGCGPCEAMYPDLQALIEEFKEKLTVVSIMTDMNLSDTTAAVQLKKLTWNIAWDGQRGPIATRFAVNHFPTIYVVGPDGTIAYVELRGERLRSKIVELCGH